MEARGVSRDAVRPMSTSDHIAFEFHQPEKNTSIANSIVPSLRLLLTGFLLAPSASVLKACCSVDQVGPGSSLLEAWGHGSGLRGNQYVSLLCFRLAINILEVHRPMMVTSSISNVNYQGLGAASSCRLLAARYACSLQAHEYYDTGRVVPMCFEPACYQSEDAGYIEDNGWARV